ncbi:hypothetical protein BTVI_12189 [Pitangus sulphuratus]|nr:hypothetical protein BTVI_12189 [Pitangus sulphuratus]
MSATWVFQSHLKVFTGLGGERKGNLDLTELFLCPLPMYRPSKKMEGAQLIQLPTIKLFVKMLSHHNDVLLALLEEQGLSTEELFWFVASVCISRELREVLVSGMEVNLQSQPAQLLASTLKVNPPDLEPCRSQVSQCEWEPAMAGD